MVATSTSARKFEDFIALVSEDYPNLTFLEGAHDHWSPRNLTITYKSDVPVRERKYSVLHELAHAQLGHANYHNDFELLKLESLAWQLAAKIGKKYGVKISDAHVQD